MASFIASLKAHGGIDTSTSTCGGHISHFTATDFLIICLLHHALQRQKIQSLSYTLYSVCVFMYKNVHMVEALKGQPQNLHLRLQSPCLLTQTQHGDQIWLALEVFLFHHPQGCHYKLTWVLHRLCYMHSGNHIQVLMMHSAS